jgi:hypothetical protein
MGFDALYVAARIRKHGMEAITSQLMLKAGETAVFKVPCTLVTRAGRRNGDGAASRALPLASTGVRFKVGSYRDERLGRQPLKRGERGTLVVTSQRLSFDGERQHHIPLGTVERIDIYIDALGIFVESRVTPHLFLLDHPKETAFYINCAMRTRT